MKLGVAPSPFPSFDYSLMEWQCITTTHYVSSYFKHSEIDNQISARQGDKLTCNAQPTMYPCMPGQIQYFGTMMRYPVQEVSSIHSQGVIRLKH